MLELVRGGTGTPSPNNPAQWKATLRELESIAASVQQGRISQGRGPRATRALFFTLLAGAIALIAMSFFERMTGIVPGLIALFGLPLAAAAGANIAVRATSTLPDSWAVRIDDQLSQYTPLEPAAYQQLQEQTRQLQHMGLQFAEWTELILAWIDAERKAIADKAGVTSPSRKSKFLDKKL